MEPTRHDRRRERSRAAILEAALELFRAQGLEATTLEQICERADVANRTFFNHFPSRQDMVRALGEARLRNLHAVLAARTDQPTPARLVSLFDDIAAHLQASGPAYREVVGAMLAVGGTGIERGSTLHAAFLAVVKDGVARGEVTDRHDPVTLTDIVVGSLVSGIVNWATDETYAVGSGLHDVAVALGDLLAPN